MRSVLKSLCALGLYVSSCTLAMNHRQELELPLLREQENLSLEARIEITIDTVVNEAQNASQSRLESAGLPNNLCAIIGEYAALSQEEKKGAMHNTKETLLIPERNRQASERLLEEERCCKISPLGCIPFSCYKAMEGRPCKILSTIIIIGFAAASIIGAIYHPSPAK